MDKHLEQVWKYIDGELNPSERQEMEARLKTNAKFNRLYKSQLSLHQSLKTHNVSLAPVNFTSQVMAKLQSQSLDLKKYDSFVGVKGIVAWTAGIIAVAVIAVFLFIPMASTGATAVYSIDRFMPEFIQNFTLSNEMIKYSSYATLFLMLPVFYVFDNFLNKKTAKAYK